MKLTTKRALLPITLLALGAATVPAAAAIPHAAHMLCLPDQLGQLRGLQSRLDGLARAGQAGGGQYWYVDQAQCRVAVAVLRTADTRSTDSFLAAATESPELVNVTVVDSAVSSRVATVPAPPDAAAPQAQLSFSGGTPIFSGTSGTVYECTSGFNNYHPGTTTTAGHCGKAAPTWYDGNKNQLGSVSSAVFPGHDWAVITPTGDWTLNNTVIYNGAPKNITNFAAPKLGEQVCGTGATSGTQCGYVEATNVSVNYSEGVVTGLVESTQNGNAGDSGGPVYDGGTGLGLISGGPEGGGGPTFFQPLNF
ncbi:hypothetical protein P3T36_000573 [Kitasatospora sp. MAP12-15]|uniref:S1 family peptidase n=1 Tax=unclassified Kitasatospora TaxID=2633591 RepID=UPI002476C65A|nr:S1 family peptidase [Kitasatospora sp. MAP12-44]MDH6114172.1 hypothetical protein [Kitasatospora sp. MAP12-44]